MKKLFLAGIAVLFLATGTAQAVEWQCGPHYVSTFVLHGAKDYSIVAYPFLQSTAPAWVLLGEEAVCFGHRVMLAQPGDSAHAFVRTIERQTRVVGLLDCD
jgi:hypothetical protein